MFAYRKEFKDEFNDVANAFADAVEAGIICWQNGVPSKLSDNYIKKEAKSKALATDLKEKFHKAGYNEMDWRHAVRREIFNPAKKILASKGITNVTFREEIWFK
jgi:hypothetical protein